MLSIKCPNCGGTVRFDESHIATICCFCGSHLPEMTDYVKKSANLKIQQQQHAMDMETIAREAEKKRLEDQREILKLQNEIKKLKIQTKRDTDVEVRRMKAKGKAIGVYLIGVIILFALLLFGPKLIH